MTGRARRALTRLRPLADRLTAHRRGRRREEGAVFPIVVLGIILVFAMAAVLFYVGRAGDLRTRAQVTADASALGAAAEIRDRALEYLVQGSLPFSGFDPKTTPAAAREYAKRNNGTVTKVDYGDFFARTVKVDVHGNDQVDPDKQPKFAPKLAQGHAKASAIATVDFPLNCTVVIAPGHPGFIITGVQCGGTFIPKGANPKDYIHLFKLRLVDKLPPKCGLGGIAGSGKTARPVLDITPSSGFGPRGGAAHNGVDLPGGGLGQPIYAFADGLVVRAGQASGFGNWIVIDHNIGGQKVSTVYGHMRAQDIMVKASQPVKAGQPIARVGNEGHSTGPHLHFEYWQGGRFGGQPVDPYPYVQAAPPPGGGTGSEAAIGGVNFACGPVGPGGPVNGDPGDAKLCAQAAKAAGFSGEDLVTITAIGMAESGCRPNASNANTNGSVDYGLFQINTVHGWPTSCLFDPTCNAQKAFELYSRRGSFLDWCTYEAPACGGNGNASYRKYLGTARQAVSQL